MDVNNREKHRCAVHMSIANQPAPAHVAHYSLDRIEGKIGTRCILGGQDNAGDDHDHEHDPGQRTVVPPIAKVPWGRVFVQLVIQELHERQSIIDPADNPGCGTGAVVGHGALLADSYRGIAGKFVKSLACRIGIPWQPQIERRRALADPSRSALDRAMTRAEPPAIGTAIVTGLLTERDATEMRADADYDQPFRFLDAVRILLRIAQL